MGKSSVCSVLICAALCAAVLALGGCGKKADIYEYVSECRTCIYLYSDDETEVKIYCGNREQPYAADGYIGDSVPLVEIYASFLNNPDTAEITVWGQGGEMNYKSVENSFVLTFTAQPPETETVEVSLTLDGKQKSLKLQNAKYGGVIDWKTALKCVTEHDGQLFASLTDGQTFNGEISVRLLTDDGKCFYYVAVCDRNKSLNAYLVDGESGKVIAQKTS